MLLRLHSNCDAAHREALLRLAQELGYQARFLDAGQSLVALEGAGEGVGAPEHRSRFPEHRSRFEDCAAVRDVLDHGAALERHERAGAEDGIVAVGEARFGGGSAAIIAGPCAVEDEARLFEIARSVRESGASVLRGGAYKPRTSPYSFQGLGERGLEMLAAAREATGLAVVTEVLDPRDVERVGRVADMFQVGARSMANAPLLTELGRTRTPILLKRGMAATVREFLLAAEYVLAGGNDQVVLCERGIRSFDSVTRNVLDLGAVAHLKRATHLPVVVDPSHAAGRAELVPALARAGLAVGADGLAVEVHPAPGETRSDGAQAVSLEAFRRIARDAAELLWLDGRRLEPGEKELVPPQTSGPNGPNGTPEPIPLTHPHS